jgi:hypothetical protein
MDSGEGMGISANVRHMRRRISELIHQMSFSVSMRSQLRLVVCTVLAMVLVALLLAFYNVLLKILMSGAAFTACAFASWWWFPPYYVRHYHPEIIDPKERADVEDNFRKNVGQALGGIVVLLGAWMAYVQTGQTLMKTEASQEIQRKSARDLLYSQQFSKAFDQLGTVDQKGSDLIITQLGGIYTLEGIMKEYRWRIVEAIAAFIRVRSPRDGATATGSIGIIPQTALTVLGRRDQSPEESPINLEQTNLRKANLPGAKLESVILRRSDLTEANLNEARLVSADLSGVILTDAAVQRAVLTGAILTNADLTRATLLGARLQSSNLTGANLTGADLTNAVLTGARMQGARLMGADLTGATYDDQTILPDDVVPAQRKMIKIE